MAVETAPQAMVSKKVKIKTKPKSKLRKKKDLISWMFVMIPTFIILVFYFYPMIQAFWLSLHSGAGMNLEFVGARNYQRLFTDTAFRTVLKNTGIFLVFQIPVMIFLGLIFSVILNNKSLKFKGLFRTIVFLPSITSLVAYSVVFKYLFSNNGIVNQLLVAVFP